MPMGYLPFRDKVEVFIKILESIDDEDDYNIHDAWIILECPKDILRGKEVIGKLEGKCYYYKLRELYDIEFGLANIEDYCETEEDYDWYMNADPINLVSMETTGIGPNKVYVTPNDVLKFPTLNKIKIVEEGKDWIKVMYGGNTFLFDNIPVEFKERAKEIIMRAYEIKDNGNVLSFYMSGRSYGFRCLL